MTNVRAQFPQLKTSVRGQPLVYLDSAATTLKPSGVIAEISRFYSEDVANVHRGAHWLADHGTEQFEAARAEVATFVGASAPEEIIFTRGTTESINLVASSMVATLGRGDEILLSHLEHHSNIVPWQLAAERSGATIRFARLRADGGIDTEDVCRLIGRNTRIVSLSAYSNVLGSTFDVRAVANCAHAVGAAVLVDAAQAVTAFPFSVVDWDIDFLAFSGHKIFAPFGIGVLYGNRAWLNKLGPYQGGGSMIDKVSLERSTWADVPHKFEAGTPNVEGAIALAFALRWYGSLSFSERYDHPKFLASQTRSRIAALGGFEVYGPSDGSSIVSFNLMGIHASDVGSVLDQMGIAVRTGHHCCQPLMQSLSLSATIRASFSVYNNHDDADRLIEGLKKAQELLL